MNFFVLFCFLDDKNDDRISSKADMIQSEDDDVWPLFKIVQL